jgi:hypothetical protein
VNRKEYLKSAYDLGVSARFNGWERNSPYTKLIAEQYWYAGYDGEDFDKFVNDSRRSVKSSPDIPELV